MYADVVIVVVVVADTAAAVDVLIAMENQRTFGVQLKTTYVTTFLISTRHRVP